MSSDPSQASVKGLELLAARARERCATCLTERALLATTACRCATPAWQPFCPRCVKAFVGELCPHCLAVATTNGAKLRETLDTRYASAKGIVGLCEAHARLRDRVANALREFSIDAAAPPLPQWALQLTDPRATLPIGAEHSKPKKSAISELRMEHASVNFALSKLGPYLGYPVEEKLRKTVSEGDEAASVLAQWDFIAADSVHERVISTAAESLVAADQQSRTLLDSIMKRDLTPLVEAVVRRGQALERCSGVLGIR